MIEVKFKYESKNIKLPFCTQRLFFSGFKSLASNKKKFSIKLLLNLSIIAKVTLYV